MARWTHTVGELETVSLENRKLKRKSDLNYEQAITGRNFLPFPQLSFNGQSGNLHDTDVLKQTQWGRSRKRFVPREGGDFRQSLRFPCLYGKLRINWKCTKSTSDKYFKCPPKYHIVEGFSTQTGSHTELEDATPPFSDISHPHGHEAFLIKLN